MSQSKEHRKSKTVMPPLPDKNKFTETNLWVTEVVVSYLIKIYTIWVTEIDHKTLSRDSVLGLRKIYQLLNSIVATIEQIRLEKETELQWKKK